MINLKIEAEQKSSLKFFKISKMISFGKIGLLHINKADAKSRAAYQNVRPVTEFQFKTLKGGNNEHWQKNVSIRPI